MLIDDTLQHFVEGRPDHTPTRFSQRMTDVMTSVIALLGEEYTWGNAWDEFPKRCHVVFNVGHKDADGITYRLFGETHRNLALWSDAQLVNTWVHTLRAAFEEPEPTHLEKSDESGCL